MTVKTVALHRKLFFFSLKVLKTNKKKLALTSFYCQSRNMVGQFKKAYLHKRPIKILHCLTPARIQKCLT